MEANTMNGYKAFYKGKNPIEVYANSSYAAQCQATVLWNLKPSKRCDITVVLCEKNGQQVTHIASE
jgi:hypothetical protein